MSIYYINISITYYTHIALIENKSYLQTLSEVDLAQWLRIRLDIWK